MADVAKVGKRKLFAWWRSRKVRLGAVGMLAGVVLVRLSLMTYWSLKGIDYAFLDGPLLLAWCLGLIALAMLSRFAWHIWREIDSTNS